MFRTFWYLAIIPFCIRRRIRLFSVLKIRRIHYERVDAEAKSVSKLWIGIRQDIAAEANSWRRFWSHMIAFRYNSVYENSKKKMISNINKVSPNISLHAYNVETNLVQSHNVRNLLFDN